jgi:hypothetical protein
MPPIVNSFEVGRPPEEVYAYLTDPSRFPEWQHDVLRVRMEDGRPPGVGARFTTTRQGRPGRADQHPGGHAAGPAEALGRPRRRRALPAQRGGHRRAARRRRPLAGHGCAGLRGARDRQAAAAGGDPPHGRQDRA